METLLEKVIALDYKIKGNGPRWRTTEEHSSLVLDLQEQVWFWNSKELAGNPIEWFTKVKNLSLDEAKRIIKDLQYVQGELRPAKKGEISTPNEKLVEVFWEYGQTDKGYWNRRCLNDSTIDRFRLGKYDGFWMLPVYMEGVFRNFQMRTDVPEKRIKNWYTGVGPLLFNSDILSLVDYVYITEGPVDALLLAQLGFPAVSHTGGANGWQSSWFKYFTKQKTIYYVADNDAVGIKAAKLVSKSLGENRVKIITFEKEIDKFDFVDFIREGRSIEEFKELVKGAKLLCQLKTI
jgi:hypothetical protein